MPSRLSALDPARTSGQTKELLEGVHAKVGMTPNLMKTMAHAPVVLKAYLGFVETLAAGRLDAKLRERITVMVSDANGCEYCLSAHTAIGKTAGVSDAELSAACQAASSDPKIEAALRFAREVIAQRGEVTDEDLKQVRQAGYTDEDIAEIIANVALTIFSNYFNLVARTDVDFPAIRPQSKTLHSTRTE